MSNSIQDLVAIFATRDYVKQGRCFRQGFQNRVTYVVMSALAQVGRAPDLDGAVGPLKEIREAVRNFDVPAAWRGDIPSELSRAAKRRIVALSEALNGSGRDGRYRVPVCKRFIPGPLPDGRNLSFEERLDERLLRQHRLANKKAGRLLGDLEETIDECLEEEAAAEE